MGEDSALGSSGGFMGAMTGEPLALDLPWPDSTDCKQHASHAAQAECAVSSLDALDLNTYGAHHCFIKLMGIWSHLCSCWDRIGTLCRCCNSSSRGDLPLGLSKGVLLAVGRKLVARVNKSRLTDSVLSPSSIMQQPVTQPGGGANGGQSRLPAVTSLTQCS